MEIAQAITYAIAATSALGALLAFFKWRPGQREAVDLTIAQANMNVAQGTFQMVTTELEDQFRRMAGDMARMQNELDEVRREVLIIRSELATTEYRLGVVTEQRDALRIENNELLSRINSLQNKFRQNTPLSNEFFKSDKDTSEA